MKAVEEKRSIITFEEEEHLYHYKGTRLSSVTSALKPYFPFDMEGQLYRSAYQVLFGQDEWKKIMAKTFKYDYKVDLDVMHEALEPMIDWDELLATRELIREEWRMSGVRGTEAHLIEENKLYAAGEFFNHRTKRMQPVIQKAKDYDNQSVALNYYEELEDGCYPELLVHTGWDAMQYVKDGKVIDQEKYDEIMRDVLPGQSDIVCFETIGDERFVDIYDHKFMKREPRKYYNNKALPPLDKFKCRNDKIQKFECQLGTYMHSLVKMGFTPRHIDFIYYKDYNPEDKKIFKLKYRPDLIESILEDFNNRKDI